jgi:hypothetical protein
MKFCRNCGYGLENEVGVCTNCNTVMDAGNTLSDDKLNTLSERIKINGIIWLVIGIFQLCTGVFFIVGILNIISAIQDLKASKNVFHYRVGLVNAYKPLVSPIIVFIYNLIFGGVIGVIGSIYYFLGIRGYVMDNKEYFAALK